MIANSDLVLVAGATGGVGQLVVAKLLEKNIAVLVLTRNEAKAKQMFEDRVAIAVGDIRHRNTLSTVTQNVTHIICCTGTTAFPSSRWDFKNIFQANNSPEEVDAKGVKNLLAAASDLKRFVFVSSAGVLRKDQFPFNLLNAFGVLDAKLEGEKAIASSGFPYTIIRPGRLIDGPYTSYDLNTLLKAKTDGKQAVVIAKGDDLNGQTSRIDVANACVECLFYPMSENKAFAIINSGNKSTSTNWEALFAQLA
ncbi:NAD-dependent epimerase/dehydratase [Stanieria cyanosphaera PCC 7437]|uniref:NAD-dependent epimerase/dehydratase n=1 Tax=Stanieria cyanosphaera (strain ATCC 29371 / PCC 7437) TaxID=111780 RepID=K9XP25_STAC7|nr:SDR family oxidoreductase [Stanieria cyanosphaera]AFZ33796.1 NAD-dependent epimerase/dehydratase [Stanieria cyanosphaera PCC 7437]